jgi:hypothetical protein
MGEASIFSPLFTQLPMNGAVMMGSFFIGVEHADAGPGQVGIAIGNQEPASRPQLFLN